MTPELEKYQEAWGGVAKSEAATVRKLGPQVVYTCQRYTKGSCAHISTISAR